MTDPPAWEPGVPPLSLPGGWSWTGTTVDRAARLLGWYLASFGGIIHTLWVLWGYNAPMWGPVGCTGRLPGSYDWLATNYCLSVLNISQEMTPCVCVWLAKWFYWIRLSNGMARNTSRSKRQPVQGHIRTNTKNPHLGDYSTSQSMRVIAPIPKNTTKLEK